MLGLTGIILAVLQLGVFPSLIKCVGIVNWQRAGCLLGVPVFLAIPNVKSLSWNESSLFAVNVMGNLLAFCSISSVRRSFTGGLSGLLLKRFHSLFALQAPSCFSSSFFVWCRLARSAWLHEFRLAVPTKGKQTGGARLFGALPGVRSYLSSWYGTWRRCRWVSKWAAPHATSRQVQQGHTYLHTAGDPVYRGGVQPSACVSSAFCCVGVSNY